MGEYKPITIYFDMGKPDDAWAYQYLKSLHHGKKAVITTALKMMLGKGEQPFSVSLPVVQPSKPHDNLSRGLAAREQKKNSVPRQNHPPDSAGDDVSSTGDSEQWELVKSNPEPDFQKDTVSATPAWMQSFTAEQLSEIEEKGLDMEQLTGEGIRQMAKQVQGGIPVKAAYREALMWCQ